MSSTPTTNPPTLLPSALPRDNVTTSPSPSHSPEPPAITTTNVDDEEEVQPDDAEDLPYPEPTSESLLPPPNFNPFFTLIEDSSTGEHYHPSIHYVFADDDPVIVTAAAMRSLGIDDSAYLPSTMKEGELEGGGDGEETESPLPPPVPGIQERYILVDVAADGQTVVDAQSLSAEWQITQTQVRPAPSFDEESGAEGLMMMVEGVEVPGTSGKLKQKGEGVPGEKRLLEAREKAGGDVFVALEGLVTGFEKEGGVARKVVLERQKEGEREGVEEEEKREG